MSQTCPRWNVPVKHRGMLGRVNDSVLSCLASAMLKTTCKLLLHMKTGLIYYASRHVHLQIVTFCDHTTDFEWRQVVFFLWLPFMNDVMYSVHQPASILLPPPSTNRTVIDHWTWRCPTFWGPWWWRAVKDCSSHWGAHRLCLMPWRR